MSRLERITEPYLMMQKLDKVGRYLCVRIMECWMPRSRVQDIRDIQKIMSGQEKDPELIEMAAAEMEELEQARVEQEQLLVEALLPRDEMDTASALLEIRAGMASTPAFPFENPYQQSRNGRGRGSHLCL